MDNYKYECKKCGYYQIGLQYGEICPSCGRKLKKTTKVITEQNDVFVCKFCGHRQVGLSGSYLCPSCHHTLVPLRSPVNKKKKNSALPWLLLILLILLCVFAIQNKSLLHFPELPHISEEISSQEISENSEFVFSNQTSDIVTSRVDGQTYFTVEADVKTSSGISHDSKVKLRIVQNDKTIYSESINIGLLTSFTTYHYSKKINLTTLADYRAGSPISYHIQVSGRRISLSA